MRIIKAILVLIIVSCLLFSGCKNAQSAGTGELTVSAAASLKEPIEKIAELYEKETNVKININLGSSGSLQKQIEEGAPVDLLISAQKSQVDALINKGLIEKGTCKELLTNSLVLIVSNNYDKIINSMDALKNKDIKLALGEAETVPAGLYAKEFLQNIKLWESLKDRIIYTMDVKAVLNYVESGDAEAGIVYRSDAVNLKSSYIAYMIPTNTHQPIIYPAVVMEKSNNKASAKDFIEFLGKSQSREVFQKYNFGVKDN